MIMGWVEARARERRGHARRGSVRLAGLRNTGQNARLPAKPGAPTRCRRTAPPRPCSTRSPRSPAATISAGWCTPWPSPRPTSGGPPSPTAWPRSPSAPGIEGRGRRDLVRQRPPGARAGRGRGRGVRDARAPRGAPGAGRRPVAARRRRRRGAGGRGPALAGRAHLGRRPDRHRRRPRRRGRRPLARRGGAGSQDRRRPRAAPRPPRRADRRGRPAGERLRDRPDRGRGPLHRGPRSHRPIRPRPSPRASVSVAEARTQARAPGGSVVTGELVAPPRGPVALVLLGVTGLLAAAHLVRLLGRVALRYRRPAELTATAKGVTVKSRTELLGRTLRQREVVIPVERLLRATREVRYPRLGLYAGLFALAVGSYFGVSLLIDGVRTARPSSSASPPSSSRRAWGSTSSWRTRQRAARQVPHRAGAAEGPGARPRRGRRGRRRRGAREVEARAVVARAREPPQRGGAASRRIRQEQIEGARPPLDGDVQGAEQREGPRQVRGNRPRRRCRQRR